MTPPTEPRLPPPRHSGLAKCPTGIPGLDQITQGGLPRGRTTLVCGGPGCGKTLLGLEFLVQGVTRYDEAGVLMSFEESTEELAYNVASLGHDLTALTRHHKLFIDTVHIAREEIEEGGEYDLEGLFIRLNHAIETVAAKRVVLDTLDALFAALPNVGLLRAELQRLFRWLKHKGVTTLITAERGTADLTRHGLEAYVSDCVILLDQRIQDEIATRRLRIIKYRGSAHGNNEYPFLLDSQGFTVFPLTAIDLEYEAPLSFVSTGIAKLDTLLGGQGFYRGSTVLVSGTSGTGKSSVAAHFVDAACRRGEPSLYLAFEESPEQIMRNMRTLGIDLRTWRDQGLLRFQAARPTSHGLEMCLAIIQRAIEQFQPVVVTLDPISSFAAAGNFQACRAMLMRLVDFFKSRQITTLLTRLSDGDEPAASSEVAVSSLIDTWLLLRNVEQDGERTRTLSVLKGRGLAHNSQVHEFLLTERGIELVDVYKGSNGMLTAANSIRQRMQETTTTRADHRHLERQRHTLERKPQVLAARIAALRAAFESECQAIENAIAQAHGEANDAGGQPP